MNRIDEVIKLKVEDVLYDVCVSESSDSSSSGQEDDLNREPVPNIEKFQRRGRPRKGQSKGSVTAFPLKKFANESLSDSDFKNRKKATLKE
ncbi:hypothetical protein Goarm_009554, partial [Gossypium armourianum]|nr:hypothetical protein [Gossypium armourianum]